MSITFRELPDGYGVRAEVDLMDEARKRIRRKIDIDGEKALELALAEVGYIKERTCKLIDRGRFMPKHDFYRSECSACGAMFWQTNGHLPRANYCPNCGAKVVE